MLRLKPINAVGRHLRLLCLGAHCDDIEIGCGGSILRLLAENDGTEVCWTVFSSDEQRIKEATESAGLFLANARDKTVSVEKFKTSFFPYMGGQIKEYFEKIKQEFEPDMIFTHYRNDLHQDHRLINELTWNTFRDHMIFEYEIMKYDGDIGNPNFFIHLDKETCDKKIEYILKSFKSQQGRGWFKKDVFFSLLRLRGVESNSPHDYAEGFYCRKAVY
jgi:LmbE family N-acetylglucosaminyl deacetylase